MPNEHRNPTSDERDEPVVMPHDDAAAVLKAMLNVDPDAPVAIAMGQHWTDGTTEIVIESRSTNRDGWSVFVVQTGLRTLMTDDEIRSDYTLVEPK